MRNSWWLTASFRLVWWWLELHRRLVLSHKFMSTLTRSEAHRWISSIVLLPCNWMSILTSIVISITKGSSITHLTFIIYTSWSRSLVVLAFIRWISTSNYLLRYVVSEKFYRILEYSRLIFSLSFLWFVSKYCSSYIRRR